MRIYADRKAIAGGIFVALIFIFFGNQNSVFASDDVEAIQIVGATLSKPGTPHIISGENSLKPTWSWEASKSLIVGPIHYLVEWCGFADFSGCANSRMYVDTNSFSFDDSNQLSNDIWYMRVRVMDEFGHGSPYSATGLGTLHDYFLVTPYNFKADLAGNKANLSWYDCFARNFRVYGSITGEKDSFKPLGETESYLYSADMGGKSVYWFYLTAIDEWGNESLPSEVVEVETPGLKTALESSPGGDLASTFKPILDSLQSALGSQIAGANAGYSGQELRPDEKSGYFDFLTSGYFGFN